MKIYNLQFKIYKKFALILIAYFLLFAVPQKAQAFTIEVFVDTGKETINALEGELLLPPEVVVKDIYTGKSAILIWINEPREAGKTILFSGISPGGFQGKHPLFTLDLEPEDTDLSQISFQSVLALKNDGAGTASPVRLSTVRGTLEEDDAPPEPFKIFVSSSPELFDGKLFASFTAQDKGTGIEKYEYAAAWIFSPGKNSWQEVQSPAVLKKADNFKRIYIRAFDKAGNVRTISTPGPYWYATLLIGLIILICVLLYAKRFFSSPQRYS